jgi:hypothetical protein
MKIACFMSQDQKVSHIARVDERQPVVTPRLVRVGRLTWLFDRALLQESA